MAYLYKSGTLGDGPARQTPPSPTARRAARKQLFAQRGAAVPTPIRRMSTYKGFLYDNQGSAISKKRAYGDNVMGEADFDPGLGSIFSTIGSVVGKVAGLATSTNPLATIGRIGLAVAPNVVSLVKGSGGGAAPSMNVRVDFVPQSPLQLAQSAQAVAAMTGMVLQSVSYSQNAAGYVIPSDDNQGTKADQAIKTIQSQYPGNTLVLHFNYGRTLGLPPAESPPAPPVAVAPPVAIAAPAPASTFSIAPPAPAPTNSVQAAQQTIAQNQAIATGPDQSVAIKQAVADAMAARDAAAAQGQGSTANVMQAQIDALNKQLASIPAPSAVSTPVLGPAFGSAPSPSDAAVIAPAPAPVPPPAPAFSPMLMVAGLGVVALLVLKRK